MLHGKPNCSVVLEGKGVYNINKRNGISVQKLAVAAGMKGYR